MSKKKTSFSGLLLIDKPKGITSHSLVFKARKILQEKRIGHTGTLDPMATGLMVVMVGQATKLGRFLTAEDKSYRVRFQLGLRSDTEDITGELVETNGRVSISKEHVLSEVSSLEGKNLLRVPNYSAVKVNGRKLYEYARSGQDVPVVHKEMVFWNSKYVGHKGNDYEFDITCSKGSYIRAWVREIGEALGVGAVMTELRRTRVGPYSLSGAVELETLESDKYDSKGWIPLGKVLSDEAETISVSGKWSEFLRNGQVPYTLEQRLEMVQGDVNIVKIVESNSEEWISLLERDPVRSRWKFGAQFV